MAARGGRQEFRGGFLTGAAAATFVVKKASNLQPKGV